MSNFRQDFLAFALARDVLRFGEFTTKAGRRQPLLLQRGIVQRWREPASRRPVSTPKRCSLPVSRAIRFSGRRTRASPWPPRWRIALAEKGHNLPFSYNRKEAKDHGEGGQIVGAPLKGRVMIVDDVITAGTSVRESVETDPRARGATRGRADRAGPDGAGSGLDVGGAGSAADVRHTGGGHRDARGPHGLHRGPAGTRRRTRGPWRRTGRVTAWLDGPSRTECAASVNGTDRQRSK